MTRIFKIAVFFLLPFLFQNEIFSQLGIKISTDRKTYLQYEPIYVKVQVRNYSGKTLVFGETDDMQGAISFIVKTPGKGVAEIRKKNFNPMLGIVLPTGGSEQIITPVNRLYVMNDIGNYSISAFIKHKLLPSSYDSNTITFNVCSGKTVWEKLVGVPEFYLKEGDKPDPRTIKLISFYDGTGNIYSLLIEDSAKVYGVARIGYDIGGSIPECEIDGLSRIHMLVPVSPSLFAYFCYDINCNVETKEAYLRTSSAPTLILDPKEGTVMVAGGKKAVKDVDYVENEDGTPTFK